MTYTIYGLVDPRNNEVRYVGITRYDVNKRVVEHKKAATKGLPFPVCRWLRKLVSLQLEVEWLILEQTEEPLREIEWIEYYRSLGNAMLNCTAGGEGSTGFYFAKDKLEAMSQSRRGRPLSEEHKRKLSESHKGQKFTKEQRRKLSEASKGRRHRPDTIEKMRKPKTPEHRANAAAALNRLRQSGKWQPARGDQNGLRLHPESALKGSCNPNAKLTEDQVRQMRREYRTTEIGTPALARKYGVRQGTVWRIVNGQAWKHVVDDNL